MCSPQIALPLDTTVTWYVNGKALKTEFYPRDLRHLYESLQDLTDLLGDVPKTVSVGKLEKGWRELGEE